MSSHIQRPLAGLALAATFAVGLFAAAPRVEAAPLTPTTAIAGEADAGLVQVQYGYGRHHHHGGWGHRRHGWGGHHRGWGHRHHGWGGPRHHGGWGHRHHGYGHHRW